jgi:hypothetical protein
VERNRQRRGTTRGLIGATPKLRRRGIGGVLFEHDFASRALQFGFERAMAQAISHRQRFVEDGRGAAWIASLGYPARSERVTGQSGNRSSWLMRF